MVSKSSQGSFGQGFKIVVGGLAGGFQNRLGAIPKSFSKSWLQIVGGVLKIVVGCLGNCRTLLRENRRANSGAIAIY